MPSTQPRYVQEKDKTKSTALGKLDKKEDRIKILKATDLLQAYYPGEMRLFDTDILVVE